MSDPQIFAQEIVKRVVDFSDALRSGEEIEIMYSERTTWLAKQYGHFAEKKGYTVVDNGEGLIVCTPPKKGEE
jgi:hypothetical protein